MRRWRLLVPVLGVVLLAIGCRSDAADTDSLAAAAGDTSAPMTVGPGSTDGAMLDPNTATREELTAAAGMSDAAADALIAGRPYGSMLQADSALAPHMSAEQRSAVYAHVWRPIDLNTASGEEILLIPGVGDRMRHEFEEYRPYRGIEQFRREIGKYVDSAEVARLERYVAIR